MSVVDGANSGGGIEEPAEGSGAAFSPLGRPRTKITFIITR